MTRRPALALAVVLAGSPWTACEHADQACNTAVAAILILTMGAGALLLARRGRSR